MAYTGRLEQRLTLSFMRVGITRCMVYACFGLLKRYMNSECDTVEHLQSVVQASVKCNSVQPFESEWSGTNFFHSSSSHFQESHECNTRYSQDSPGIVVTRRSS